MPDEKKSDITTDAPAVIDDIVTDAPAAIDDPAGDLRSLIEAEAEEQDIWQGVSSDVTDDIVIDASAVADDIVTESPAVIDDVLPGGPRKMHNLGPDPVWVETKTQLALELASRGLVQDVRDRHAADDKSPWATRTRLRPGAVDPFMPLDQQAPPAAETTLPASTGSSTRTTATLGETRASVEAMHLSLDQLRLIREYTRMLGDAHLDSWLYCKRCLDPGNLEASRCQVHVRLDTVLIICSCCLRFGNGATALSSRLDVPTAPFLEFAIQPTEVAFPLSVAQLFRRFDTAVLMPLLLKEALRCTRCLEAGRPDGTSSPVTSTLLDIRCRCQHRVYRGAIG